MGLVAFAITLVSVVSSVIAGVVPALLLSFILPVSLAGPPSQIPSRLAGWLLAGAAALLASVLLWPAPRVEPLRDRAARACRELSAALVGLGTVVDPAEREQLLDRARAATHAAHQHFVSTPYRPSSLGAEGRALIGLVDQLTWITTVIARSAHHPRLDPLLPSRAHAQPSRRCSIVRISATRPSTARRCAGSRLDRRARLRPRRRRPARVDVVDRSRMTTASRAGFARGQRTASSRSAPA
jgi:uncharacterized membrane protein YccC